MHLPKHTFPRELPPTALLETFVTTATSQTRQDTHLKTAVGLSVAKDFGATVVLSMGERH